MTLRVEEEIIKSIIEEQGINSELFDIPTVSVQIKTMRENIRKVKGNQTIDKYTPIFTLFQRREVR